MKKNKMLTICILGMLVMTCITAFSTTGIEQKLETVKEKSTTLLNDPYLYFTPSSHDFGKVGVRKVSDPFTFTLHNGGEDTARFILHDREAFPVFHIKGGTKLVTLKAGKSMSVNVCFNPFFATGEFDGRIKAERVSDGSYAEASVYGESVRNDAKDSLIHQLLFNLLERMPLLKNILRL